MAEHVRVPIFLEGHRFEGPDGQAYELTRDVFSGEIIKADQFRALNGAPEQKPRFPMPDWLAAQLAPGKSMGGY